jgi:hypothetical protein
MWIDVREWARTHLDKPHPVEQRVTEMLNDPKYRDRINGIADSLNVTRYRAGWLILHYERIDA